MLSWSVGSCTVREHVTLSRLALDNFCCVADAAHVDTFDDGDDPKRKRLTDEEALELYRRHGRRHREASLRLAEWKMRYMNGDVSVLRFLHQAAVPLQHRARAPKGPGRPPKKTPDEADYAILDYVYDAEHATLRASCKSEHAFCVVVEARLIAAGLIKPLALDTKRRKGSAVSVRVARLKKAGLIDHPVVGPRRRIKRRSP